MKVKNAKILIGTEFVESGIRFGERIEEIGPFEEGIDLEGGYIIPGLVDIHTHGGFGQDFSDGEDLRRLSKWYGKNGVTSFLATTMTLPEEALSKAMEKVSSFRREDGARLEGVNLEGPFLSYEKKGAQCAEYLKEADFALFSRLNERSGGNIKLITVAPEKKGALPFIEKLAKVTKVSLGHSAADYDTAVSAFRAGASHVTHLFNAMDPFLHRAPGIVGAAFDQKASVETISDGFHLHPSIVRAIFCLFEERVDLISDSIRCTGLSEGEYELGGQKVFLKGGRATLENGTLAGSSITLLEGLKRAISFGVPPAKAVYAATTAPAKAAGLNAGSIEKGKLADLLFLDRNFRLKKVFLGGKLFEG